MGKTDTAPKGWGETDMTETLDQYESDMAGGAEFFKFKDGDNEVRVCPPAAGEKKPFASRAQHWRIGDNEKIFNCPGEWNVNANCVLCAIQKQLKRSDDDADTDKAEDMYAKRQFLYRIIDCNDPKQRVQVMNIGIKAHKQIARLMKDKEWGNITDPVTGVPIIIEKTGSGRMGTEYTVRPRKNAMNIVAALEAAEPPNILGLCEPATNKAMKTAWENGTSAGNDEPPKAETSRRKAVDDDEPRTSRRKAVDDDEPRTSRRKAVDDDEPRTSLPWDDDPDDEGYNLGGREQAERLAEAEAIVARAAAKNTEANNATTAPTPKRATVAPTAETLRGRRIGAKARDED